MKTLGVEIRHAAELVDSLGDLFHVLALVFGVLDKLLFDALAVDADGRHGVHRGAQDAHDFGRQGCLQELDGLHDLALVVVGDGTPLDVLFRTPAEFGHIGNKWLRNGCHGSLLIVGFGFVHCTRNLDPNISLAMGRLSEMPIRAFGIDRGPRLPTSPRSCARAAPSRLKRERMDGKPTSLPLRGATFAVVDVETTGLDPQTDRVVEIACVLTRAGSRVATFSTLVNPGRAIPPRRRRSIILPTATSRTRRRSRP